MYPPMGRMRLALVLFLLVLIVILSVLIVVLLLVLVLVVVLIVLVVLIFVLVVVLHNEHSFFIFGIPYSLCPASLGFMRVPHARLPCKMVEQSIQEGCKRHGGCNDCGNTDPPDPWVIQLEDRLESNGSG